MVISAGLGKARGADAAASGMRILIPSERVGISHQSEEGEFDIPWYNN